MLDWFLFSLSPFLDWLLLLRAYLFISNESLELHKENYFLNASLQMIDYCPCILYHHTNRLVLDEYLESVLKCYNGYNWLLKVFLFWGVQAVYLKRKGVLSDNSNGPFKGLDSPSVLNPLDPIEEKDDLIIIGGEEAEDGDIRNEDSDIAVGFPVFQNILRDMIPGVKVKVLKLSTPGKVDKDVISKVIEQIIEEEEDEEEEEEEEEDDVESEKDTDFEDLEVEDKIKDDHQEKDAGLDADDGFLENQGRNEVAIKIIVGGLVQKLSGGVSSKNVLRVPAKLDRKGRSSFSFSIENVVNEHDSLGKEIKSLDRKSKPQGQGSIDHVMLDLAKFVGKEKIPLKVGLKFLHVNIVVVG